jgi:hypothetical protein
MKGRDGTRVGRRERPTRTSEQTPEGEKVTIKEEEDTDDGDE